MGLRIGIDAHFVGVRHGGNEHHFGNVIAALGRLPSSGDKHFVFNYDSKGKALIPAGMTLVPLCRRSVYLQRGLEIPRLTRDLRLDVLHVPFNFLPVGRAKKVVTIHDLAFLHVGETFDWAERKRMSLLTGLSARKADHIFTVSEYSKADIVRAYGVPEKKITVTYNAVDCGDFFPWPEEEKRRFLAERGIDYPFLLFVGTLQPRKNVHGLIEAFKRLTAGPAKEVHLVLVGRKGWIYDDIFRRIRESGLESRIHHMEHVDMAGLAGLYNTALGLVFPSFFEGFGMPLLEAMACGCPVASANVTSMPEIYGDAALPFDPVDAEAMADAMRQLALDAGLRTDLAARGHRVRDRFSWDRTAETIRKAYHSL